MLTVTEHREMQKETKNQLDKDISICWYNVKLFEIIIVEPKDANFIPSNL